MKQFYQHIKYKYDEKICYIIKQHNKNIKKLAKQKERLKFLLRCKDYGIIPSHLQGKTKTIQHCFKLDTTRRDLMKLEQCFLLKVVNLEIKESNINIKIITTTVKHLQETLQNRLQQTDYEKIIENHHYFSTQIATNTQSIHNDKLQKQISKNTIKFGMRLNEDWFVNNTNIEVPQESRWLLSLGNKFALPVSRKTFSPIEIIADLEQCVQSFEDEREKDTVRSDIAAKINTFQQKIRNCTKDKFILKTSTDTKRFLNQHRNEIIITNADKGNKTFMMYKNEYELKMKELLNDKNTYKTIRNDPTQKLMRKNNTIINNLYKQRRLDAKQKFQLTSAAANAPRLYGLPKIHKPHAPFRPICSSINKILYPMILI
ncbi:uncharacterized protein [Eurosta solidaginis]|uniref:uncharacterized protein n=1 Tax=Eurosta solidaginis TaxID=178769 RepID=UPI0035311636